MSVSHIIPVTHPAATAAPAKSQSHSTAKFQLPATSAAASAKPPATSTAGLLSGASLLAAHSAASTKVTTPAKGTTTSTTSTTSTTTTSTPTAAETAASSVPTTINAVVHDHISLNVNPSGTSGLTYSANGLPDDLSMSANGQLTGLIMAQNDTQYHVTVSVRDSDGNSSSQNVLLNVLAHHYSGWNNANVSVVAPQTVSKTVTDDLGKTSTFTYPLPYQNP